MDIRAAAQEARTVSLGRCYGCNCASPPNQLRSGPCGPHTLCNRCFFRLRRRPCAQCGRPMNLNTREIRSIAQHTHCKPCQNRAQAQQGRGDHEPPARGARDLATALKGGVTKAALRQRRLAPARAARRGDKERFEHAPAGAAEREAVPAAAALLKLPSRAKPVALAKNRRGLLRRRCKRGIHNGAIAHAVGEETPGTGVKAAPIRSAAQRRGNCEAEEEPAVRQGAAAVGAAMQETSSTTVSTEIGATDGRAHDAETGPVAGDAGPTPAPAVAAHLPSRPEQGPATAQQLVGLTCGGEGTRGAAEHQVQLLADGLKERLRGEVHALIEEAIRLSNALQRASPKG